MLEAEIEFDMLKQTEEILCTHCGALARLQCLLRCERAQCGVITQVSHDKGSGRSDLQW
jgi:hypothetical protein